MLYLTITFQAANALRTAPTPESSSAGILRLMEVNPAMQKLGPLEEVVKAPASRILRASERDILAVAGFLPADIALNTGAAPPLTLRVRFFYHFYQVGGSARFNQLLKHLRERFR